MSDEPVAALKDSRRRWRRAAIGASEQSAALAELLAEARKVMVNCDCGVTQPDEPCGLLLLTRRIDAALEEWREGVSPREARIKEAVEAHRAFWAIFVRPRDMEAEKWGEMMGEAIARRRAAFDALAAGEGGA